MEIAMNMEALAKSNCAALLSFPSHPLSHILTPHFFLEILREKVCFNSADFPVIDNSNGMEAMTFLTEIILQLPHF